MNLLRLAAGATAWAAPPQSAVLRRSTGYEVAEDGTQIPLYAADQTVTVQIQSGQGASLTHADGLCQQGEQRTVFLRGQALPLSRPTQTGGDLLVFADGSVWLVVLVAESWPSADGGWCRVTVERQADPLFSS